jgi:hypothetical protein
MKNIFFATFIFILFFTGKANAQTTVEHFVIGDKIVIKSAKIFIPSNLYYCTGSVFTKISEQQLQISNDKKTIIWTGWTFTNNDLKNLRIKAELKKRQEISPVHRG